MIPTPAALVKRYLQGGWHSTRLVVHSGVTTNVTGIPNDDFPLNAISPVARSFSCTTTSTTEGPRRQDADSSRTASFMVLLFVSIWISIFHSRSPLE